LRIGDIAVFNNAHKKSIPVTIIAVVTHSPFRILCISQAPAKR
tara:strand:- start:94157 stop:94285 length:129 start_codon:yes stop_codon:yes gene_type:complete